MKPTNLGDQELQVLQFVTDNAPVSVREAAEHFGATRGLARTTILTVMERLRKKGYLTRQPGAERGAFVYSPALQKTELMQTLVHDFVEKTLGGSLTPFVAYLADARDLSKGEVAELRRLVEAMDTAAPQSTRSSSDDDGANNSGAPR